MDWQTLDRWLTGSSLPMTALILFGCTCVAALAGVLLSRAWGAPAPEAGGSEQENYIVAAVLGLLALLLGFTLSLAVDRFDVRRNLVIDEANAIGTAYLRAQLLADPHRERMSALLIRYTDNRVALAKASPGSVRQSQILTVNDALITDIWAATSAAFDSIRTMEFSSAYLDSVNALIDLDAARKAARSARVPSEVFAVLFIYLIATAGVLGYVLRGSGGRLAAGFLMVLLTISLSLTVDINRPLRGGVTEAQTPMEDLQKLLASQPSAHARQWSSRPDQAARQTPRLPSDGRRGPPG